MSLANVLLVDDEAEFVETFSERLELRDLDNLKSVQRGRGPAGT